MRRRRGEENEFVEPRVPCGRAGFVQASAEVIAGDATDDEGDADFFVEGAFEEWEPREGGWAQGH
jgi:hypothetical protein